MLPLSDSIQSRRAPVINLTLIALNVAAFLYELSLGPQLSQFVDGYGAIPARVTAALAGKPGVNHWVLLSLLTAMFLHAGWLHLGGNMLFLWIFGDNVEDRLGHVIYVLFYLTCGIIANLAEAYALPTSTIPAIGASGAIAGVLGAYIITYPGARVSVLLPILLLFPIVEVPALIMIGLWFATQFFNGVASLGVGQQSGGTAWWAHVGGFVIGMMLMTVLPKSAPALPDEGFLSVTERARRDSGMIGLLIGTVSLVSQLLQIVILIRLVVVFLGTPAIRLIDALLPTTLHLIALTSPLVRPFALMIPRVLIGEHVFEVYDLVAIVVYYVIGAAIVRLIASAAFGNPATARPARRLRPGSSNRTWE